MRRAGGLLALLAGLAAGPSGAEAPARSVLPPPRPAPAAEAEVTRAALVPMSSAMGIALLPVPQALALAPVPPALHPHPRPGSTATAIEGGAPDLPGLRPKPRPPAAYRPAEVVQPGALVAVSAAAVTRPLPRPENLPRLTHVAAAFRTQPVPEAITGRKGSVCGDPAIKGTTIPPITSKIRGCGLENGVAVTSVAGVALSQPATIDCATAIALRKWVETGIKPAVGKLGGGVARLEVAGHYTCRPRNGQRGAKISEHGHGKAIDISGITLANGVSLSVLKGWGDAQQGKILKAAHRSACGTFGTVLGPGSDGYHRDHIHVDTASYRSGSYCR